MPSGAKTHPVDHCVSAQRMHAMPANTCMCPYSVEQSMNMVTMRVLSHHNILLALVFKVFGGDVAADVDMDVPEDGVSGDSNVAWDGVDADEMVEVDAECCKWMDVELAVLEPEGSDEVR